ncbi:hypothetical protein LguiA_001209 [Lonicera macranthoides]
MRLSRLDFVSLLPHPTRVKVNFNGARFQEKNQIGLGAVLRNGDDTFLAGHSLLMPGLYEAEVVEAFAVVEAIKGNEYFKEKIWKVKPDLRDCYVNEDYIYQTTSLRAQTTEYSPTVLDQEFRCHTFSPVHVIMPTNIYICVCVCVCAYQRVVIRRKSLNVQIFHDRSRTSNFVTIGGVLDWRQSPPFS